ncbi:hypothetical protein D3C75_753150 [compost metagenome]
MRIGDQRDTAGVVEHLNHFIRCQARIDRYLDQAGLVESHLCFHQFGAVGRQDGDMLARGDALCQQGRGQLVGPLFELSEGQPGVAVDHRQTFRPVSGTSTG